MTDNPQSPCLLVHNVIQGKDLKAISAKLDRPNTDAFMRSNMFLGCKVVPDVWRYNITIPRKSDQPVIVNDLSDPLDIECSAFADRQAIRAEHPTIVVLLESPHRDEYTRDDSRFKPIAPAQGDTGTRFRKRLPDVINEAWKQLKVTHKLASTYSIILANPIQWQASLARYYSEELKKSVRNRVWKCLWNYKDGEDLIVQRYFKDRLREYKPRLIINACTANLSSNIDSYFLRSKESQDSILDNCRVVRTYHPSSWMYHKLPPVEVVIK
jgi:hypothetical protein